MTERGQPAERDPPAERGQPAEHDQSHAATAPSPHVIWHDLECGAYRADLPLWRTLAAREGGPVLDVGAGAGRVALDLARAGHEVVALDRDPVLLEALRERADGLRVTTVEADARDFELGRRFPLILAPMQTVQLLEGGGGRERFLCRAARHLRPGGLLAAALAEELEGFSDDLPLPDSDVAKRDGWTWLSQPTAVRHDADGVVLERLRETVAPDGRRDVERDRVHLDRVTAATLEREAAALGLRAQRRRRIAPTEEHVGSTVVMLRA